MLNWNVWGNEGTGLVSEEGLLKCVVYCIGMSDWEVTVTGTLMVPTIRPFGTNFETLSSIKSWAAKKDINHAD